MSDKQPSKVAQVAALRIARATRQQPNPFEDAARGRDPAPTSALKRADGLAHQGPAPDDGQYVAAVGSPKGPATATNLEACSSTVELSAHNAPVAGSTPAGPTKKKRAPNGTFDRKKYQRELMRERRRRQKEQKA